MNVLAIFALVLCELISMVFVWRLWTRKKRPGLVERLVLSVILFVPVFGWIFYGLVMNEPEAHPDRFTNSGWGESGQG